MKKQLMIMKEEYNRNKFTKPTGNRSDNKPISGGIWTSELIGDHSSDWDQWAIAEEFYDDQPLIKYIVEPQDDVRVLRINNKGDYIKAINKYGVEYNRSEDLANLVMPFPTSTKILNYEKIMMDYDCIQLTREGIRANNESFFTWDCESTVWFTTDKFASVEKVV